jgi:transcription antitermination factor NusA-like protein|tara:strand:- start:1768 stop:2280 length:513 start_codon:yes stop_codon:yes gene_type:complete
MSLKTPICAFDAKTGILCPKCEAKLKGGHLTRADVDLSVKLSKAAEKIPELNKTTLIRAVELDEHTVLMLGHGDLAILGRDSSLVRKIEESINKRLSLVEAQFSDRRLIEYLFRPINIVTVNVVWLPDGSKMTKVIIPGRKNEQFPVNVELVQKLVKAIRGIDLMVEFEN